MPPPRRWSAYRLRTIFLLMAVAAAPLAWGTRQFQIVSERKATLTRILAGFTNAQKAKLHLAGDPPYINWLRRKLGDFPVAVIPIPRSMFDQRDEIQKVFSESEIVIWD